MFRIAVRLCLAFVAFPSVAAQTQRELAVSASEEGYVHMADQVWRDPEIAVREEFEMLSARGTVEALELFIARHPDHPLVEQAKRRIAEMQAPNRPTRQKH